MQSSLQDLSRRERRRLIARAVASTTVTVALLFVLYALAPVPFAPSADALVRLAVVLVIVAVVIAVQVRAILGATYPEVRAIQSLVTAMVVFLVLFALLYLGLSAADPASFSRVLTRVSALYFTVTVLSTVGFGDITAQSDGAQLLVTVQMLLGLTLIAFAVRVFSAAARAGATRRGSDRGAPRE